MGARKLLGVLILGGGCLFHRSEALAASSQTSAVPGLMQTLRSVNPEPGVEPDTRRSRLVALYVPEGSSVSPFLAPGPFRSTWEGYLNLKINDSLVLSLTGRGAASVEINGKTVLETTGPEIVEAKTEEIELRKGPNPIRVKYRSPVSGDARLRLYWWNPLQPREPVPPAAFTCDSDDPALVAGESLRTGRFLFATGRCANCHRPAKDFPGDAMPELASDSPALDGVGDRLKEAWMAQWLADPQAIRTASRMPRMLHGDPPIRTRQAGDIAAFLASLKTPAGGASDESVSSFVDDLDRADAGELLYEPLGCMTCHLLPGDEPLDPEPRLDLAQVKGKWKPDALVEFLIEPSRHYRWVRMPRFDLSRDEATALAAYVLSCLDDPPAAGEGGADPAKGRQLVMDLGCLACHAIDGMETRSKAPTLERISRTDGSRGCLAAEVRKETGPAYAFEDRDRQALATFLRSDLVSLSRRSWSEFANRQFAALQCVACHAREGESDRWSVLLAGRIGGEAEIDYEGGGEAEDEFADASDEDLESEFADEYGEGEGSGGAGEVNIHQIRPPLNFAGEKLNPDWMEALMAGELAYKTRPRLEARMPVFAAYAHGLAVGLAMDHGFAPAAADRPAVDRELAALGKRLVQMDGLGCVSCHPVGTAGALSGPLAEALNFQYVSSRLRKHYFDRFVLDPQRVLPVTMMPKFPDEEGHSPIVDILEGDARKQFEAIWNYLGSLPKP